MNNPCTKEGYKALKDKLQQLTSKDRPKVIDEIATARALGDLKENAEYHAAKEKQALLEAQIQELSNSIANANIIDVKNSNINKDRIQFGAIVEYENLETNTTSKWQLVGKDEADVEKKKISIFSPIAKGLIGKQEGEQVKIKTPKSTIHLEILSIKY